MVIGAKSTPKSMHRDSWCGKGCLESAWLLASSTEARAAAATSELTFGSGRAVHCREWARMELLTSQSSKV